MHGKLSLTSTHGEEHGIPAFADYRQMLDETKPNFVITSAPHPQHDEVAAAAAERGIHVRCEKPIAHTVSAAGQMIAACREVLSRETGPHHPA